jgi:hypothetical protein
MCCHAPVNAPVGRSDQASSRRRTGYPELGKISSGKAAALAGTDRASFLLGLGRYRVSVFNYTPEELEREVAEVKNRARHLKGSANSLDAHHRTASHSSYWDRSGPPA